jgi:hypothetical protein
MPLRDNIFDGALLGLELSMDVTPSNFLKPGDRISTGALGSQKPLASVNESKPLRLRLRPAVSKPSLTAR